jgi:17beta-estradiol 17-dehydrogenase / very-long-chain 3-oxoacyl-CoA reductase
LLTAIYKLFIRPAKNLQKLGEWAVVTGATDGIGKAYAHALAKKGLNVMLISRTEAKLQQVQSEIQTKYPNVKISYVVCDYSKFDTPAAREAVQKAVQDLDIGVLINNVGLGYRYPRFFHELPDDEVAQLLQMNIDTTVWMTRIVLPGMLDRRRGAMINLSSGSAMYTLPLLAEYSGAKSFVEKFSRALNAEYASRGVTCQCQIPFYVATKLAKMRPSFSVPTPEQFVRYAVRWIGHSEDAMAQPYWVHAVMGYALHVAPEWLVTKVIRDMHLATRKRGLKKDGVEGSSESVSKKME